MLIPDRISHSFHTFLQSRVIYAFALFIFSLTAAQAHTEESSINNHRPAKQSAQNNITVYTKNIPGTEFVLFHGTAVFNTTMDSILAVVFDSSSYVEWLYQCKESTLIEQMNFNERYQYQVINIPFPFNDRDMIIYSKLYQDLETGAVIISFLSSPDYCKEKETAVCEKINNSPYERVKSIIGSYNFQEVEKGIKMTWIQHTEPGGKLPSWLVNRYVVETPFESFLSIADKLQEEKYKQARLTYDNNGKIIALYIPSVPPSKKPEDFIVIPTF